ncbi:hypothetical protein [Flagellimonas sp. S3867]|uniref:hypothetical protein n=1 Tax=Flagellimonas sp. S3867 TaxID=2768063 RepID=UPI0016829826|nr:hypothetical protein [Flagellimonas sp. S3867]
MTRNFCISGLLILLLLISSCKDVKKENSNNEVKTEQQLKDISELSYQEIFYLLHGEDEYGIDYHGEVFGQDASEKVSLVNLESNECGNRIVLQSNENEKSIQVAIKVSFSFPGNPANEIHRLYTVKPEETTPVGHTKLCYKGLEYVIQREVVSAGFNDQTKN